LQLIEQALELEAVLQARLGGVTVLLGSQTASDVKEACRALETAHTLALDGANPAELLVLVWSREESVKRAALESYQKVWLPQGRGADHVSGVAASLLALVEGATLAQARPSRSSPRPSRSSPSGTRSSCCRRRSSRRCGRCAAASTRRCATRRTSARRRSRCFNMAAAADAALLHGSMDEQLRASDLTMVEHAVAQRRRAAPPRRRRAAARAHGAAAHPRARGGRAARWPTRGSAPPRRPSRRCTPCAPRPSR